VALVFVFVSICFYRVSFRSTMSLSHRTNEPPLVNDLASASPMIEQHPLKEQASTTYDQPPLINLASAANNNDKQMLPKHLAPVATVPNTIPLWFGFTHEHMEYSLSLLPLSELQQATRKCVNTWVNGTNMMGSFREERP
jgi:hypothetical protein